MSQPDPLVEAVCVVCQLESAHKACQAVPSVERKVCERCECFSGEWENFV